MIKNKWIKRAIIFIILVGMLYIGLNIFGFYHEQVHLNIYERYDIDTSIDYTNYNFAEKRYRMTTRPNTTQYYEKCKGTACEELNLMNDIVGYHTYAILQNIWLMFAVYLILMRRKMR